MKEKGVVKKQTQWPGPIAVGGLGGSGTRVVAEILIECGVFMGNDLNLAKDNRWFTLLFKRPKWFIKCHQENSDQIFRGLRIFEKAMNGPIGPNFDEFRFVMSATMSRMCAYRINELTSRLVFWPLMRAATMMLGKRPEQSTYLGWGWKEPNTHIYIDYLAEYFADLKYIHVIRHGLDMAFSRNQTQLSNWGKLSEIEVREPSGDRPRAALQFWIEANKRAVKIGREMLHDNCLILSFDELCTYPRHKIRTILEFVGVDVGRVNLDKLEALVKSPKSLGRYKKYDLSAFGKNQIDAVREMGFEVDESTY